MYNGYLYSLTETIVDRTQMKQWLLIDNISIIYIIYYWHMYETTGSDKAKDTQI